VMGPEKMGKKLLYKFLRRFGPFYSLFFGFSAFKKYCKSAEKKA